MKKLQQLTFLFLLSSITLFGQSNETRLADSYFENLSYVNAIQEYKILADRNPNEYVLKRLADSYYASLRMKEAAVTYARLFTLYNIKDQEYIFKYSQSLKSIGRYADALYWMEKYQKTNKEANPANHSDNNLTDSAQEIFVSENRPSKENIASQNNPRNVGVFSGSSRFTLQNLYYLNTPFSDFGVTEYQNTILFSSPRKLKAISTDVDESNKANFLDIYQVNKADIFSEGKKQRFSNLVNEKFHESSISFSPNYKVMYFTRNNYNYGNYKVDGRGYINLKIYKAEFINSRWQNIVELPFCSDNYSVGHPSVSKDGKLLYFVSDMPGSIGATDLYVVNINANGSFGMPRNLGNTINTKGREMFPFIADDNTLYFSSDGHKGAGNLDVFESKMVYQQFQTPVNLEAPINSKADDFAFSINQSTQRGYLSSNRVGGKGDDDIYSFERVYENMPEQVPEKCNEIVTGTVRNLKFQKYISFANLVLKDVNGNTIKNTKADEFGKFSLELPCNQSYVITGSKEYYKPDTKNFKTKEALIIDLNLEIVDDFVYNLNKEIIIKINDIYFDYNKWNIRPDAARELDHIIAVMNKYPSLKVTSTSHTDARGTSFYNKSLSQKRADATVDYIIYRGISPDRITGKGYGESRLTNKCVDNDFHFNRVYCSENQHQANRRTSFVIQNIDEIKATTRYR
ncbi:OmpA family protein [Polaribacter vadi]|uniref:OmpA family protein n=1 Tax=Polaribacter TaxID=52959 RepID=UPI001C0952C1|nr:MULTISPECIES: OmpA family protein [Polaribacter]MBU3011661.1 OmpA family protein [Polaribacter vadi]MDO6741474.1 OmpA family protein [Polaribacter sp. 1_MG-2023]